jgi:hypothetical protein
VNGFFVVGLGQSAWVGVLTVTPILVVVGVLLWLYAAWRSER